MFQDLLNIILSSAEKDFDEVSAQLQRCVYSDANFVETIRQIGIIPESIAHDSTEEKLFSKASDAVLSRAFHEIGLKSTVLRARGDSADVMAESPIYGYTLVADAKAFRLSRTAKNQKDYKVVALSNWRQDSDYAVLCAPYFHFPSQTSQIYSQALSHNVCLLSWEHLIFLIEHGIKESVKLDLSALWDFSDTYTHKVLCSDMNKSFLNEFDRSLAEIAGQPVTALQTSFQFQIAAITARSEREKEYWSNEMVKIRAYSRERAISELIQEKKIPQKISQINRFVKGLQIC